MTVRASEELRQGWYTTVGGPSVKFISEGLYEPTLERIAIYREGQELLVDLLESFKETYVFSTPSIAPSGISLPCYEHWSGKRYWGVGRGTYLPTGDDLMVYRAMYCDERYWARPYNVFFEKVPDKEGKIVPRFKRLKDEPIVLKD